MRGPTNCLEARKASAPQEGKGFHPPRNSQCHNRRAFHVTYSFPSLGLYLFSVSLLVPRRTMQVPTFLLVFSQRNVQFFVFCFASLMIGSQLVNLLTLYDRSARLVV